MSLFPRFVTRDFAPLFQMLDDYATNVARAPGIPVPATSAIRAFTPRFDVREHKDHYELQGELPGIEQKDISIEWQDSNTLTISGRTEHRSERGQPPAGFVTEHGEQEGNQHEYHKPTVEDEGEGKKDESSKDESSKTDQSTAVTKSDDNTQVAKQQDQPEYKYWVTERAVGEFHRTFTFPGRVDQDGVKASLKNGVLTIIVPKAKAPKSRKINIE